MAGGILDHAHRGNIEEKMGAAVEKVEKVGGPDLRYFVTVLINFHLGVLCSILPLGETLG